MKQQNWKKTIFNEEKNSAIYKTGKNHDKK